jgi:hypothetical protein
VLLEEERLQLQAVELLGDPPELGDGLRLRIGVAEVDEDLGVLQALFEDGDEVEELFVPVEALRDVPGAIGITPQVGRSGGLPQLGELGFLRFEVKGTSWPRRDGSGGRTRWRVGL